jgi:hypothetical protein
VKSGRDRVDSFIDMPPHPDATDGRTLCFERRGSARAPARGSVMAAFADEDGALVLTRVDLVDQSDVGLGLVCPVRVDAGVRFALYGGGAPLAHSTGVVARCSEGDDGFRVGLRCDLRRAA